jgi:hypothetical protein
MDYEDFDEKTIKKIISKRKEGWSVSDLSEKYCCDDKQICELLLSKMSKDDFYSIKIDFKTKNPEFQKKYMYGRIVEVLNDRYAIYTVPSASQRFIILELKDKKIGIDIKATYYDSVIKSAWQYKKYNKQVDQLYILIISKRVTGPFLKKLKEDPTLPENTQLISVDIEKDINKFQDLLFNLNF